MSLLEFLNPFLVYEKYVRTPVLAFINKQYLEYKKRTNRGYNSVKELLCRAGILIVFASAILWISVFMYVVFYYTYMPNVTHVRPVHLQFKSCDENMGVCSFPSAHVQLTKKSHMLMTAQPYRIRLMLDMPESQINKDACLWCAPKCGRKAVFSSLPHVDLQCLGIGTTDGTDDSQIEGNVGRPESVVIKVGPTNANERPTDVMQPIDQRPLNRSPYHFQLQNSLVQPEMISIIQAEINGMAQSHNPTCQNSPLNMSHYSTGHRMEYNPHPYDISDSIINTPQGYVEINAHDFSQNASRSFMGDMNETQRIYVKQNLQNKDATTQVSVPMNDFATSPINASGFEHLNLLGGNNLNHSLPEQRVECIRCLAQSVSNLAEGTQAMARAQRMLASSYKAMANAQEMIAASLQNCESWQTALAASNESIATALRTLKDSVSDVSVV